MSTADAKREREIRMIAEPGKGYPNDWMEDTHVLLRLLDQARAVHAEYREAAAKEDAIKDALKDALLERLKIEIISIEEYWNGNTGSAFDAANVMRDRAANTLRLLADYAALRGDGK